MNVKKKKGGIQRIDPAFIQEMRNLAKARYFKNLAKREPSFVEMTSLLRRTQGYKMSLEELKTKPKRE